MKVARTNFLHLFILPLLRYRQMDKELTLLGSLLDYGFLKDAAVDCPINNKEWCKKGRKGGRCHIKCEDLLNEDLSDDVRCAKNIYGRVGFKAWPASFAYCKEKSLPDLSRC